MTDDLSWYGTQQQKTDCQGQFCDAVKCGWLIVVENK